VSTYTLTARLAPAILAVLPLLVVSGGAMTLSPATGIFGAGVTAAVGVLASHLGRQAGQRLEPRLWASWGGPPTSALLRTRAPYASSRTERYRAGVERALGERLPSKADEQADPAAADEALDDAIERLLTPTREHELLAAENASYGFRRNCLGLRAAGRAFAVAATGLSIALVVIMDGDIASRASRFGPGLALGLALAVVWWRIVNDDWVRSAASAYARQFYAAVDALPPRGEAGGNGKTPAAVEV
jgi:hypothetical protein